MNQEQLLEMIKKGVSELGFTNSDQVQLSSPLGENRIEGNDTDPIGMDSMTIIELSMQVENITGKFADNEDLQKMTTVQDMVDFFKS